MTMTTSTRTDPAFCINHIKNVLILYETFSVAATLWPTSKTGIILIWNWCEPSQNAAQNRRIFDVDLLMENALQSVNFKTIVSISNTKSKQSFVNWFPNWFTYHRFAIEILGKCIEFVRLNQVQCVHQWASWHSHICHRWSAQQHKRRESVHIGSAEQ